MQVELYALSACRNLNLYSANSLSSTQEWNKWLDLAEKKAQAGDRTWNAVEMRESIVGQAESTPKPGQDLAEQHVPALEIPGPENR